MVPLRENTYIVTMGGVPATWDEKASRFTIGNGSATVYLSWADAYRCAMLSAGQEDEPPREDHGLSIWRLDLFGEKDAQ